MVWLQSPSLRSGAILIFAIIGGLGLGALVGTFIKTQREQDLQSLNERMTQAVLRRMSTLRIGSRLADAELFALDGTQTRLSSLVKGRDKVWIELIEPNCEACLQNISLLRTQLRDTADGEHFLFISGCQPEYLNDLREMAKLPSEFLIDQDRQWIGQYSINAFPFHILVNEDLVIEDIAIGLMSEERIALATR